MILEITLFVMIALVLSLGLNRVMLVLGPRLGLMDQPGARRIHTMAIPRAGGIAIWITFLLVAGGGLASGLIEEKGDFSWRWLGAFAAGSAVLMAAGFIDDRGGISPWVKLASQALAPTVFFVLHPIRSGIFPEQWPLACDFAFFVVWVVVLTNAFNLIDGLDGLCGGLATVYAFVLAGMALAFGREDSALLLFLMGGAILGFLKYNISPARIFLGDAGSMLMGFFLATAATEAVGRKAVIGVFLLPIAVAGVPLLDVLLAVWRRSIRHYLKQLRGEYTELAIFKPDKDHLHHRLLASIGSQRKAAVILHGLAIVLAALALLPLVLGEKLLAVSLVGFLIVALLAVSSLARVEIEHTGRALHMAVKLPSHRRRMPAVFFVYDLLVLASAGMTAVVIETNLLTRMENGEAMARFVVVFVILSSLALWMVRVHRRLWTRATMRDIITLQAAMLVAALATFTIFSLVYSTLEWSAIRLAMLACVFAIAGITIPRVMLDLMRDAGLEARHQRSHDKDQEASLPVVVYGAGGSGSLLLEHFKTSFERTHQNLRIVGFIDDMRVIHGRNIRSFRVLGGLSSVPRLVKEEGIKGIVVAMSEPRQESLAELERIAARYDLRIYRWKAGLEEVYIPLLSRT